MKYNVSYAVLASLAASLPLVAAAYADDATNVPLSETPPSIASALSAVLSDQTNPVIRKTGARVLVLPAPLWSDLSVDLDESSQLELAIPLRVSDNYVLLSSVDTPLFNQASADLWARIRAGFQMPELQSPLVGKFESWYLSRPKLLQSILERSSRYMYYIVEELNRRNMPTELALLPILESAFNPQAYSHARALGIWQFIPSTGKNYQLKQNSWLDERRDIVASTKAALDYLQENYRLFGDWHLTLASYNWGENAVARAVMKNEQKGVPTQYEDLRMPRETRNYVPKLLALKNIIATAPMLGFELTPIPNHPYFDTVRIENDMDVSIAAHLAEVPISEFIALNPAYHRPVIQGEGTRELVLPAGHVEIFAENLHRYLDEGLALSQWETRALKKRETIKSVAAQFSLSTESLMRVNGLKSKSKIKAGQILLLPKAGAQIHKEVLAALPRTPADVRPGRHKKLKKRGTRHGRTQLVKMPIKQRGG